MFSKQVFSTSKKKCIQTSDNKVSRTYRRFERLHQQTVKKCFREEKICHHYKIKTFDFPISLFTV